MAMFITPDREELERMRKSYKPGTRIELVHMEDEPRSDMVSGLRGTVEGVDDAGNIMVRWDNGSGLSLAYGADSCRKLTAEEIEQEMNEQSQSEDGPVMSM